MTIFKEDNLPSGTKEKILYAAFILFAEHGFEGTSTRQICEMAEVNLSAIQYYFQSKEGLYNVVIERIADNIRANISSFINNVPNYNKLPRDSARHQLIEFVNHFMDMVLFFNMPVHITLILSREHLMPGTAYDTLYNKVFKDGYTVIYELLKVITQNKLSKEDMVLRVNAIMGTIMGFRVFQTTSIRYLGIDSYETKHENIIKNLIIDQVNFILDKAGGKV